MLSIDHLNINIDGKMLFNNINVSFLNSSITYLQGPNGCGKTTFLRILAGIISPISGQIIYKKTPRVNYIGHNLGLKLGLSVKEHLQFWSAIFDSFTALAAAVHYFDLESMLDKKIHELSAGNQRKVALARLLLRQADLWLLDEADNNLDIKNRELLNNLIISKANNGGIIILTSHEEAMINGAKSLNLVDFQ